MEELAPINPTPCADLERLAAAAASVGYSSNALHSPQLINMNEGSANLQSSSTLPSAAVIPQYSSDPYDLSRPQQYATIRFAEFQPRAVFDHSRSNHTINQQVITASHNPQNTRVGTHFTVINPDQNNLVISRARNYAQHIVTTKNLSVSQGSSNIHYFPVDVRNISNAPDTLAIAVSQAGGIQLTNATQVNSQQVLQFVPHPQQAEQQQQFAVQQQTPLLQQHRVIQSHEQPQTVVIHSQETLVKEPELKPQTSKKKHKKSKHKSDESEETEEIEHENVNKGKIDLTVPDPVEINGKKYFVCLICNEKYNRKYLFRRHQIFHTGEKRGALSLETKGEIIKRIKNGEKQVDLAMEYNVGRSTLSFIMKNADKFLGVLKNGKFHPDSKRLRGAQREDVEAALYEWYKQASHVGIAISGPILCRKARDFASKLGYQDFKATHGWLDRFKRRKHIVLGRTKSIKEKDNEEDSEEFKEDFADIILPNVLVEFESNDVFHASEIGLLYRIFPSKASQFKGTRCAGGTNSKKRITVLMCTNMTGSEKFPLLVIGKHAKPKCFRNVKSLPVQYLSNEKSWMTKENFLGWLTDLNSWFVQQNRKILLVLPHLPIHPKAPKLSAVRVIVSPSNFVGPAKLGIAHSLKRNYRRGILESFLNFVDENSKVKKRSKKLPMKLSLLSCLHKLAAAWHAVTDVTISNSFQRSALGKYGLWSSSVSQENTLGTENLDLLHRLKAAGVKVPNFFTFDDFVTFDDEVQVCHFMDDDDIIASVTGADIESSDSDEDVREELQTEENKENTEDDEYAIPSFTEVEHNLKLLRTHIAHQSKGSQEMFGVLSHLEYLLHRSAGGPSSKEQPSNTREETS